MIEQFNTGEMPKTDFRYEEFEGLLGSYYLTILPLRQREGQDRADFEAIATILDGFAQRHRVQKPEDAVAHPRPTPKPWGQPLAISSCFSILDLTSSFYRDFGVSIEPQAVDGQEWLRLGRLLLGVLHRHGVIQAEFEDINGVPTPVRMVEPDREKFDKPLQEVLDPTQA